MGRADDVERYVQVLSLLRAADLPVPRSTLVERVTGYAASLAAGAHKDSLTRAIHRDVGDLNGLGFRIDNVAAVGEEARFVLGTGTLRVPVDLDAEQRRLLAWVMAAAGATTAEESGSAEAHDVAALLGDVPVELGTVQAALSGRRSLRIDRYGNEMSFAPGALVSRQGRWYVLGLYEGQSRVKGPLLDNLGVLGLGAPLAEPVVVGDVDLVLDATAWGADDDPWHPVEVCCETASAALVATWFPRAAREDCPDGTSCLRFDYRDETELLSRVLGLAGSAWIASPPTLVEVVRRRAESLLAGA